MIKNVAITVFCLTTLISAGWGWHERQEIRQLQRRQTETAARETEEDNKTILELRDNLKQEQAAVATQKMHYETTIRQLNTRLADRQSATAAAARPEYAKALDSLKARMEQASRATSATTARANRATSATAPEKAAAGGGSLMSDMAKMMKNPEMKRMVQTQQKAVMDMTYGQLYSLLNLPEDQLATFKGLLEKKQSQVLDISLEMLDNSLTPEQKAARQKQITDLNAQSDKEIETLLGQKNNTIFKSYEETQAERMQVQLFNQGLDTGMQLNDQQQLDLVFAMHKARADFKFTSDLGNKNNTMDPSTLTPEMMNKFMEENKRLNTQYVNAVGGLLSPAQLEKFRATLEQQQAMQELGLRMMVGGTAGK